MGDFNIKDTLLSIIGYKGLPYPGLWMSDKVNLKTQSDLGSILRKKDAQGRYYFLPVTFIYKGKEYEIPNALISFTGKKTIVETAMVGRQGSVKELISIDDYEISIQATAHSTDFPEAALTELKELYNINEAVTLKCALTDIFMDKDDKVVIKSIDLSDMKGSEEFQVFKMELITDQSFVLTIE